MKTNVLVIDNDDVVLYMIKVLIKKTSFCDEAHFFKDAQEGLDFFRESYSQDENFVLLLDVNMPYISGWEFLNELAGFAQVENTFAYIITSSNAKEDAELAKQDPYARDLIVKPVLDHHLQELKEQLDL